MFIAHWRAVQNPQGLIDYPPRRGSQSCLNRGQMQHPSPTRTLVQYHSFVAPCSDIADQQSLSPFPSLVNLLLVQRRKCGVWQSNPRTRCADSVPHKAAATHTDLFPLLTEATIDVSTPLVRRKLHMVNRCLEAGEMRNYTHGSSSYAARRVKRYIVCKSKAPRCNTSSNDLHVRRRAL